MVTLAEATVPDPPETVQVCPDGLVFTVTLYAAPLASAVANVNDPFAVTLRSSPPLSCSTTVPDSPETVPPTEYDAAFAAGPVVGGGVAVRHDARRAAGEAAVRDRNPPDAVLPGTRSCCRPPSSSSLVPAASAPVLYVLPS